MPEQMPQGYTQYAYPSQPMMLPQQNPYQFTSAMDVLKSDDVIMDFRLLLMGKMRDKVTGELISISEKPLLNAKGIGDILFVVASNANKVSGTSDYEKEQIEKTTNFKTKNIIYLIVHNWREYDMDRSHRDIIVDLCEAIIYAELRGSLDAGKRTAIYATNIISENRNYNPPVEQPKQSIIPNPLAGLMGKKQ